MVTMGIFNFFQKKSNGHLTDEDRAKGLELRRMQTQIQQLEKQLMMKEHLNGLQEMASNFGGKSSSEEMLISMVLPLLLKGQQVTQSVPQPNNNLTLNDEQSKQIATIIKSKVPKQFIDQFFSLTDGDIRLIKQKLQE